MSYSKCHYAEQIEDRMESLHAENRVANWLLIERISCLESQVEQLTDRMNLLLSINNGEAKMKSKIERVRDWPWEANDE